MRLVDEDEDEAEIGEEINPETGDVTKERAGLPFETRCAIVAFVSWVKAC